MPYPKLHGGGTRSGGLKSAAILKARDPDFYRKIGSIGGSKTNPKKGFGGMSPEKRSACGRKGGSKSSREGIKTGRGTSRSSLYKQRKRIRQTKEPTAYELYTAQMDGNYDA